MYEIWLMLNIVWELALSIVPFMAAALWRLAQGLRRAEAAA